MVLEKVIEFMKLSASEQVEYISQNPVDAAFLIWYLVGYSQILEIEEVK